MNDIILEIKKYRGEMAPFALILYELLIESKPDVVFEIGTRHGYSTRTILSALEENKKGKLYSCDIQNPKFDLPEHLSLYWNFKRINSLDYHKEWKLPIDVLVIDGDHHYDMAKSDFENYEKFVKKGGYIFMHDTVSWEGVTKFLPEIKYPKINFKWVDGMALVQK